MHMLQPVEGRTIDELYPKALSLIFSAGRESSPRDKKTKEALGVQLLLQDARANILTNKVRYINPRFAVAEWLWIMAGRRDVATIVRYNQEIKKFSDDGETFFGAYGPRLAPQWRYIFNKLREPDTRQAVATIWIPSPPMTKDVPCTIALQFLWREKMNLIVTMRSSDAWLGIPYDMFSFSMMLNCVAGTLKAPVGFLLMQLGSFHLYDRDWEQAERIASTGEGVGETIVSPCLSSIPPAQQILDKAADLNRTLTFNLEKPWADYCEVLWQPSRGQAFKLLKEMEARYEAHARRDLHPDAQHL